MCKFYDTLPTRSKTAGNNKKRNLALFMKPCPEENGKPKYYRFRLLNFGSDGKNDRDFPFIKRFQHTKWGKNDKGLPVVVDQITCPVTPHVHVEGNRYQACKVCEAAGKYFGIYKASGYTDKEAGRKNKEFSRKLEWIIPVYVVDDPNYENNNGKLKVIIFDTKDVYEDFKEKLEKAALTNRVFNGVQAVDCCIHVSMVEETKNAGKPNEYVWKHKAIDKIVFSNKPYDIPSINKETVSNMGFDEEYYTSSTPAEIQDFYNKYCKVSNDDIPEDDIPVYDEPVAPTSKPSEVVNAIHQHNEAVSDADNKELEDLVADVDLGGSDSPDVDENEPSVEAAPTAKAPEVPVATPASSDSSSSELDDLLNGIDV